MSIVSSHRPVAGPQEWTAAVADVNGAQLVLAGPGTGKTDFLAERVATLLGAGVRASEMAVLTFSRRAADELETRIGSYLDRPVSGAGASTFHSFAQRLVETHRHGRGLGAPILLTGPEQVRVVAGLLADEDPGSWPAPFRPLLGSATLADEVAEFAMHCHERLLTPDDVAAFVPDRPDWRALPGFLRRYRTMLGETGKIDYALLVCEAVEVVATTDLAHRYGHVVVDEYQDTSPAQARLAEAVGTRTGNITVAADPHQSIYSFRGAEIDNVEGFTRRMATGGHDVATVLLEKSHRVPPEIMASAARLVAPNRPAGLPLLTVMPADHRGAVEAHTFDQRSAEAEWIAGEVERLAVSEGKKLATIAVLVRSTRHLLPELIRALKRRSIPHDQPDTRLVDHPAVRIVADVVTAATTSSGPADVALAVRRLLLGPVVGLALGRERELTRRAHVGEGSWPELIRREVPEASGLADLVEDSDWAGQWPAVDGFWHLWDRLPGVEEAVADPLRHDYRVAWSRLARILERQAERDPGVTLADWLGVASGGDFEASPLLSFTRPEGDRLTVTTLHQAKGLEFDIVFIADAVEGVFPDTKRSRRLLRPQLLSPEMAGDPAAHTRFRLEEERRIAYTATTRARQRVVWTATTAGLDEGERRPSRFILAAVGAESFDAIGPPPVDDDVDFRAFSFTDAESRLRRRLADPTLPSPERVGALAVLVGPQGHWDAASFAGVPEPGPDTGLIRGELRLSPSQATSYDACPRRYALERRLKADNADSPYARFGTIVHEILEASELEAMAAGKDRSDLATALDHLDRVWRRYPPFGPPPLDEAWRRRAATLLEGMYEVWPGGDSTPAALEIELKTDLGGVQWTGRADRVDLVPGGVKIVDYKTSKNPPTIKDAARSLQLGYYLLAAAEHPELASKGLPVAAELWYPLAKGNRKVYPFEMANLDDVRHKLVQIANDIAGEEWGPRVSGDCDRCAFRGVCPAWPDGRDSYR